MAVGAADRSPVERDCSGSRTSAKPTWRPGRARATPGDSGDSATRCFVDEGDEDVIADEPVECRAGAVLPHLDASGRGSHAQGAAWAQARRVEAAHQLGVG